MTCSLFSLFSVFFWWLFKIFVYTPDWISWVWQGTLLVLDRYVMQYRTLMNDCALLSFHKGQWCVSNCLKKGNLRFLFLHSLLKILRGGADHLILKLITWRINKITSIAEYILWTCIELEHNSSMAAAEMFTTVIRRKGKKQIITILVREVSNQKVLHYLENQEILVLNI